MHRTSSSTSFCFLQDRFLQIRSGIIPRLSRGCRCIAFIVYLPRQIEKSQNLMPHLEPEQHACPTDQDPKLTRRPYRGCSRMESIKGQQERGYISKRGGCKVAVLSGMIPWLEAGDRGMLMWWHQGAWTSARTGQ